MSSPKNVFDEDEGTAAHRLVSDGSVDNHKLLLHQRQSADINSSDKRRNEDNKAAPLVPLTPLEASATVVNLVLATGPFAYPQGFAQLGPVMSIPLLLICTFMAYITATFMIEAVSVANAEDSDRLQDSVFQANSYKSPIISKRQNAKDANFKKSPFYIRQKIEIGVVADKIARPWVKVFIMIILTIYMYGAICLKYVGGAESFVTGVNHTFWPDDPEGFQKFLPFDPYFLGLGTFGFFSVYFSFGDIQNAKTLQVVTTILRFVVTLIMCGGSIYYISSSGTNVPPLFDFEEQITHIAKVFGNTTFAFIYHHSISGIIYPVRPQSSVKSMFLWSNIIGAMFLCTEAMLAWIAFGSLTNRCVPPDDWPADKYYDIHFPCAVSALYNQNFSAIPVVSQIVNFYPMLNMAAVPILNITLRNNLLDVLPIKRWIKSSGRCLFLLEDHRTVVKGVWSIILTIPVFCIVTWYRDVQALVTYTGGFCGAFILLIIPLTVVLYARNLDTESRHGLNKNKSPFQHSFWIGLTSFWALCTLAAVVYKIFFQPGGGGE